MEADRIEGIMMDEVLLSIYNKNRVLILEINRIIYLLNVQDYDKALRKMTKVIDIFDSLLTLMEHEVLSKTEIMMDQKILHNILQELFLAQSRRDYILVADIYKVNLLPMLYQLQIALIPYRNYKSEQYIQNVKILEYGNKSLYNLLVSIPTHKSEKDGYYVEPTSTGDVTLAVVRDKNKLYLHSNVNPYEEAMILVRSWYSIDKTEYIVYGLGMGYHIKELFLLDSFVEIEVFESDLEIIKLAFAYSDNMTLFNNPKIKLIYDPDHRKLVERIRHMGPETEFVIHYPSLQINPSSPIKEKIEDYFIQYSSVKTQLPLLNGNFRMNVHNVDSMVDELGVKLYGKSLCIVAAGPSLDKNFIHLKEIRDRSNNLILAIGTVFKKLINAGIRPDYVLVTDPNARVYKQIDGLEDCDVPMLYLSTAYHGFAANYKGKKYMICQQDYPKAEELAKEKGLTLIRTGGSVSTTALDIGITFGCKRIIFLGLDLAYTDNFAHASDTSRRKATELSDMRQVEDINGNQIKTSRSLDIFRQWIENRIRDVKGIEFIDATEGGARIMGMRIAKLKDVLE